MLPAEMYSFMLKIYLLRIKFVKNLKLLQGYRINLNKLINCLSPKEKVFLGLLELVMFKANYNWKYIHHLNFKINFPISLHFLKNHS